MAMIKSELVARLAEQHPEILHKDAEASVNTMLQTIADALANGDRVELRGFGAFSVRHRDGRTARNPRTGSAVPVPPKAVPYFKPGKEMRSRINRDDDEV
jgi:integration host factor subunit beta